MKSKTYEAFIEKFKPKKTTDDCMTPPEIYEAVKNYVCERYAIDPDKVIRPFWPGGDYEHYNYPRGCVVVDNPPFSILTKIIMFFLQKEIPFFFVCTGHDGAFCERHCYEGEPYYVRHANHV